MLYKKMIFFTIAICCIYQCGFAQEYINLMDPDQEVSQEFKEYNNVLKSIRKGNKLQKGVADYYKVNTERYKKLISLSFFAAIQNTFLRDNISEIRKNKAMNEFSFALGPSFIDKYLLFNRENYQDFDFKYRKYYLYDLYEAPCVFIGKVTQVDTIYIPIPIEPVYVIKYEMQLMHSLNNHIKVDISNKNLKFALSSFSRVLHYTTSVMDKNRRILCQYAENAYLDTIPIELRKKRYLELNNDFLIFIAPDRLNVLEHTPDEELPRLFINSFGIECFPVIGDEIVNLCHYFGDSDTISIVDAKEMINSVFDEIKSWKQ